MPPLQTFALEVHAIKCAALSERVRRCGRPLAVVVPRDKQLCKHCAVLVLSGWGGSGRHLGLLAFKAV